MDAREDARTQALNEVHLITVAPMPHRSPRNGTSYNCIASKLQHFPTALVESCMRTLSPSVVKGFIDINVKYC